MAKLYKKNSKYYDFRNLTGVEDLEYEIINKFKVLKVDELIAEPIKILNNKGYKTESSCSSHYLKDASIKLIEDNYKYDGVYEILDKKNIEGKEYELSMYEKCSGDGSTYNLMKRLKLTLFQMDGRIIRSLILLERMFPLRIILVI